jgi:hypothetical protein
VKGLGKETLDLAGPGNSQPVFFGEFVHAEDRDDILQRFIGLEHALDIARHLIVVLADDPRVEQPGSRVERVDRRINTELGDLPRQHGGRVEMGKRSADTSESAWVKRKILSTKNSTS